MRDDAISTQNVPTLTLKTLLIFLFESASLCKHDNLSRHISGNQGQVCGLFSLFDASKPVGTCMHSGDLSCEREL